MRNCGRITALVVAIEPITSATAERTVRGPTSFVTVTSRPFASVLIVEMSVRFGAFRAGAVLLRKVILLVGSIVIILSAAVAVFDLVVVLASHCARLFIPVFRCVLTRGAFVAGVDTGHASIARLCRI
jgi:hypothetical protein